MINDIGTQAKFVISNNELVITLNVTNGILETHWIYSVNEKLKVLDCTNGYKVHCQTDALASSFAPSVWVKTSSFQPTRSSPSPYFILNLSNFNKSARHIA
jgi:hypothetical protein